MWWILFSYSLICLFVADLGFCCGSMMEVWLLCSKRLLELESNYKRSAWCTFSYIVGLHLTFLCLSAFATSVVMVIIKRLLKHFCHQFLVGLRVPGICQHHTFISHYLLCVRCAVYCVRHTPVLTITSCM
jgi:hypothetical protein